MERTYLGFDFSTQQVKAVVIDDRLQIIAEENVCFDEHLPEFSTRGGVNRREDGVTVTAPVSMWIKAVDLLLDKLKQNSAVTMSHVAAIGGAAQKLAEITGSRAYERFTASQIGKLYENNRETYNNTERISLVSSFAASLFLGKYADIDLTDGSGMNLLDINQFHWNQQCLDACAPQLSERLGSRPVVAGSCLGLVHSYWTLRHALSPLCLVTAFTADNAASLLALRVHCGELALSLGTSDTVFTATSTRPGTVTDSQQQYGHVFVSPVSPRQYMNLLCFKNGSLVRERIRDSLCDGSWQKFQQLLQSSPPGNNGNIGVYWDEPEITPSLICHNDDDGLNDGVSDDGVRGCWRRDDTDSQCDSFPAATEVRALIEGQMMARRLHAHKLGFLNDEVSRVVVTGGASCNSAILQVMADIFNAPVYTLEMGNSASLGAAFLAWNSYQSSCISNRDTADTSSNNILDRLAAVTAEPHQLASLPHPRAHQIYSPLLQRYAALERYILASVGGH